MGQQPPDPVARGAPFHNGTKFQKAPQEQHVGPMSAQGCWEMGGIRGLWKITSPELPYHAGVGEGVEVVVGRGVTGGGDEGEQAVHGGGGQGEMAGS